jgi:hypothetical protein
MPVKKSTAAADRIEIRAPEEDGMDLVLVGTKPYICNRMSEKAKRELLLPRRKTAADRAASLKHDPLEEFRASPYRMPDEQSPALGIMASGVKKAMASAAVDVAGASKAAIERLVWVEGDLVPLWGIPQVLSAVTRSSDMQHTPDIRTRAIVPGWATMIRVSFIRPKLTRQDVGNLLAMAGRTVGLGDWRPEKSGGGYGQFRVADPGDEEFQTLMQDGGRDAQLGGLEDPDPYDRETEELLAWWDEEVRRRGHVRAV